MKIKMSVSSITLFTKFKNTAHKSTRLSSSHPAHEVRVKCSLTQRRVHFYPIPTPIFTAWFQDHAWWKLQVNSQRQILSGALAPGKGGGRWSDQPMRSVSWEAKVLLWLHEVQGAPLVSWLHMASHSLDRRPAMNTLSYREDREGGGAGYCKFLHTPGEKGQNEKVGALPSCIKGSRLQDGLCW